MTNLISIADTISLLAKSKRIKPSTEHDYRKACSYLDLLVVDLDNMPQMWRYLTTKLDNQRGFCNLAYAVFKSLFQIHGYVPSGENYFTFINLLKDKSKTKRVIAYTDEQVKVMLKAAKSGFDYRYSTYKLLVVLLYTGARISSLSNVKLSDFKRVPGFDNLYHVYVVGKGRGEGYRYPIFLPQHVLTHLLDHCEEGNSDITTWNPSLRSSFANYSRSVLVQKLKNHAQRTSDKEELETLSQLHTGTSILHSLRKWFSVKLSNDPALKTDLIAQSLLMGHKVNSTNYKTYTLSDGANFSGVLGRMAGAYSSSNFMNLRIWEN